MSSICNVEAGYSVNGPLSADAPMFSTIVPYSATCETQSGGNVQKMNTNIQGIHNLIKMIV